MTSTDVYDTITGSTIGLGMAPPRGDRFLLESAVREGLYHSPRVIGLARHPGGIAALAQLGVDPLPAYELDWTPIPADHRAVAQQMMMLMESCADVLGFDDELRSAQLRLLQLAMGDPAFDTADKPANVVAGCLTWLVLAGNRVFGRRTSRWTMGQVWSAFDTSAQTNLALKLAGQLDMRHDPPRPPSQFHYPQSKTWEQVALGRPTLLHSDMRRYLIWERHYLERDIAEFNARRLADEPLRRQWTGRVQIEGSPASPTVAAAGATADGEKLMIIGFDTGDRAPMMMALELKSAVELAKGIFLLSDGLASEPRYG